MIYLRRKPRNAWVYWCRRWIKIRTCTWLRKNSPTGFSCLSGIPSVVLKRIALLDSFSSYFTQFHFVTGYVCCLTGYWICLLFDRLLDMFVVWQVTGYGCCLTGYWICLLFDRLLDMFVVWQVTGYVCCLTGYWIWLLFYRLLDIFVVWQVTRWRRGSGRSGGQWWGQGW